jgi:hypothetical protein
MRYPREMDVAAETELVLGVWDRIGAQAEKDGFDTLTPAEKVFFVIAELETELANGGFDQWMLDSAGEHADLVAGALREVGAVEAAAICERYFALFPGGRVLPDRRARQEQLERLEDAMGDELDDLCCDLEEQFYDLQDDLRRRMVAYAHENGLTCGPSSNVVRLT